MRMTQHTDYALRILIFIAARPSGTCTVSDVANAYDLSRHHLMKVAQRLRQLGLIETTRGRAGGIRLAKTPDKVNIGALVRATEEDFELVECLEADGGACAISPACRLKACSRRRSTPILPCSTGIPWDTSCKIGPCSGDCWAGCPMRHNQQAGTTRWFLG